MRNLIMLAALACVIAGWMQKTTDKVVESRTVAPGKTASTATIPAAPRPATKAVQQSDTGGKITLESDRRGHFKAEARIEGQRFDFLVDTGASVVVLRESDAMRSGFHPNKSNYTATVSTANGSVKAAPFRLDRIEIGTIAVSGLQAMVLPDDVLATNLLGVSFLSRLKRYEVADGRMVLEQ
jgi:aspartyl protease family protein